MKRIYLVIVLAIMLSSGFAQDRSNIYTNLLNPFVYNPSLAGEFENIYTVFNARTMINGVEGMPRSYNFGIHAPLQGAGIGAKILTITQGAFQTLNAEAAYSKIVKLNETNNLSFGLSLGFVQTSIQTSLLNGQVNLSDQALVSNDLNKVFLSSGAGLTYRYKKNIELGVAFPMLVTGVKPINATFISHLAWSIYMGESKKWKVKPNANYFYLENSPSMVDMLLGFSWNEAINLQGGYRTNGAVVASAGFNFKSFAVNYAYYHHTAGLMSLAPAQNEIGIAFMINKPKAKPKAQNEVVSQQGVQDEIDKINDRLNSIIQIEKTNPGFINVKKEISKLNSDLDRILKKYNINNPEQLKKIKELQGSIDLLISKYTD